MPCDDEDRRAPRKFRKAVSRDEAAVMAAEGLGSLVLRHRPDVVLVVSAFFISPEAMRSIRGIGARVVVLHTESPYEDMRQMAVASAADLNLINDPTHIDLFRSIAPTFYAPHAYRPAVHHLGDVDPEFARDFTFIGTGYASRVEFLERMDLSGLSVLLGGNWENLPDGSPLLDFLDGPQDECFDNADTARAYRSAKTSLNLYRREVKGGTEAGWAMGPREVEMAACGLFFLRDPRPESDEVFGMLPTFASPEDAGEQLRWWLAHDAEREAAAGLAREAISDRTFDRNAASLLRLLNT
jgi:spore maturation protein CgeB